MSGTVKVYSGPSLIDGRPVDLVVGSIEKASKNRKTGPMAQSATLPAEHPASAIKTGDDVSVCGECAFRPLHARHCSSCGYTNEVGHKKCRGCGAPILACYVRTGHGPAAQWRATRDKTPDPEAAFARLRKANRPIRLGEWGNPSSVPLNLLQSLVEASNGHTAYEHQVLTGQGEERRVRDESDPEWQRVDPYLSLAMASVESPEQAEEMNRRGYRTYRVDPSDAPPLPFEIDCPHYSHGVQCGACGLCDGTREGDKRKSIRAKAL